MITLGVSQDLLLALYLGILPGGPWRTSDQHEVSVTCRGEELHSVKAVFCWCRSRGLLHPFMFIPFSLHMSVLMHSCKHMSRQIALGKFMEYSSESLHLWESQETYASEVQRPLEPVYAALLLPINSQGSGLLESQHI